MKQRSASTYVSPLEHIILILNQPVFGLTSYWYMFSGVATNTNSIVFDLHRPHDITIYHTHANHNNADVVLRKKQCTTAPNEKNAI